MENQSEAAMSLSDRGCVYCWLFRGREASTEVGITCIIERR